MDELDREQYLTKRLPRVRTDRGPTAEWMAYLEDLHDRVAEFPQAERRETSVKPQRLRKKRRLAS